MNQGSSTFTNHCMIAANALALFGKGSDINVILFETQDKFPKSRYHHQVWVRTLQFQGLVWEPISSTAFEGRGQVSAWQIVGQAIGDLITLQVVVKIRGRIKRNMMQKSHFQFTCKLHGNFSCRQGTANKWQLWRYGPWDTFDKIDERSSLGLSKVYTRQMLNT